MALASFCRTRKKRNPCEKEENKHLSLLCFTKLKISRLTVLSTGKIRSYRQHQTLGESCRKLGINDSFPEPRKKISCCWVQKSQDSISWRTKLVGARAAPGTRWIWIHIPAPFEIMVCVTRCYCVLDKPYLNILWLNGSHTGVCIRSSWGACSKYAAKAPWFRDSEALNKAQRFVFYQFFPPLAILTHSGWE